MTEITRIAIDTSKAVFTLHGVTADGRAVLRRNLRRQELMTFLEKLPPKEVAMEACGGSHQWGRTLAAMGGVAKGSVCGSTWNGYGGHTVRLIPPQYVKPFVKGGKSDRNDAEAISEASARPNQRTVPVKSAEQQARAVLLSVRELLVGQRTQLVNALRGHAAEFGLVAPLGGKGVAQLLAEATGDDTLPGPAKEALALLGAEIDRLEIRLAAIDVKLMAQHKATPQRKALAMVPGIGPIGALSLVLRVDFTRFKSGRHFASWLGLTARALHWRQNAPGRDQPGRRRTAAPAAGAGGYLGDPARYREAIPRRDVGKADRAGPSGATRLVGSIAEAQAAQARGSGFGQQDGPHCVGGAGQGSSRAADGMPAEGMMMSGEAYRQPAKA